MQYLWPGIDLRPGSLRAAKLAQDATGIHLANFVEAPLPADLFGDDGAFADERAVADAIAAAMRVLGFKRRIGGLPCVTGLSAYVSAMQVFERAKIRNAKHARRNAEISAAEFARRTPLDEIDRCSITVRDIGEGGDKTKAIYLVVKTLARTLASINKTFALAKCTPIAEHEAFALVRALGWADAIIDIGSRSSLLVVSTPNGVPVCESFGFGGDTLSERASRGGAVDLEMAQARIFSGGVSVDGSAEWVANTFASDLQKRIAKIVDEQNLPIHQVVLTGIGARVPGIVERIEAQTMMQVRVAALDGLQSEGIPAMVLADLGPSLTTAVGHALWHADEAALATLARRATETPETVAA